MSNEIAIGKEADGAELRLDVARLIKTRLLVTANSGGGKSWLLRLLFEKLGESTQLIVLDREGEFVTLREKLDVVLVGSQGEIPTDVRSAALLVRRLMEKHLSAVVDMSELPLEQQRRYVALFLDAMIALPKELWRPCFLGLDETHLFCPEKGDSISAEAVINLTTLGRKRGFCPIFATQRISKFNKDAAAELLNKFIGRTTLDIDQKRAADELGIDKTEGRALRDLSSPDHEGEFYAFGPALLTAGVTKIRVGKVKTTHPEAGQGRTLEPPKPSRAIAAVVAELVDLPKQAAAEIKDLASATARIAELETELQAKKAGKPSREQLAQATAAGAERQRKADEQKIRVMTRSLETAGKLIRSFIEATMLDPSNEKYAEGVRKIIEHCVERVILTMQQVSNQKRHELEKIRRDAADTVERLNKLLANEPAAASDPAPSPAPVQPSQPRTPRHDAPVANPSGRSELTGTEKAVLDAAASFPGGATRQRISIFSGRSNKSSTFDSAFVGGDCKDGKRPSLVQAGLLAKEGDKYMPTPAGLALASPTQGKSVEDWCQKLKPSEALILKHLASIYPQRQSRGEIASVTGRSAASSTFDAAFPALRELGLIEGKQDYAATAELMKEGSNGTL